MGGQQRQQGRLRLRLETAVAAVTVLLCLRQVFVDSLLGWGMPVLISFSAVAMVAARALHESHAKRRGPRSCTAAAAAGEHFLALLSGGVFSVAILGTLFACSVVMQYDSGYGQASSVYIQSIALALIGIAATAVSMHKLLVYLFPAVPWRWLAAALGLALLAVLLYREHSHRTLLWHKGLTLEGAHHKGKIDPAASACEIGLGYWRWRYMFPHRAFNWWTGSMACDAGTRPNAKLRTTSSGSARELVLECLAGEVASYVEGYPFLRSSSERVRNRFSPAVLSAADSTIARRQIYDPSSPAVITSQHVQAFCGEREAVLVQDVPPPIDHSASGSPSRKLNILLVMLDAVSRAEFHYSLPETAQALEELHNSPLHPHSVFEFFRYQTIGYHTQPNLGGLFSGVTQVRFQRFVKEWEDGECDDPHARLGLIFRQFKRQHQQEMFPGVSITGPDYRTGFALGDCVPQLSEYWNTTAGEQLIDVEQMELLCHRDYTAQTLDHPFKGPYSVSKRCIAGKPVHSYNFDLLTSMLENAARPGAKPVFAMSQFMEGHETSQEVLPVIDTDLSEFLINVADNHPDTLVMLFSDHGNHMSVFKGTSGGAQEQSLGMMFMLAPNWLLDENPGFRESLEENQQSIVTLFNLYAALMDLSILYGPAPALPPTSLDPPMRLATAQSPKGRSLFTPLGDRTCDEAHVGWRRCRCEAEWKRPHSVQGDDE